MRITKLRLKHPGQFGVGGGSIASDIGAEHVITEVTSGFYAGYFQVSHEKDPENVTLVPPGNVASVSAVYDGTVEVDMTESSTLITQPAKKARK
jgi:hypothetical protein